MKYIIEALNSFAMGSVSVIIVFTALDMWDFKNPLTKYWFIISASIFVLTTVILRIGE